MAWLVGSDKYAPTVLTQLVTSTLEAHYRRCGNDNVDMGSAGEWVGCGFDAQVLGVRMTGVPTGAHVACDRRIAEIDV